MERDKYACDVPAEIMNFNSHAHVERDDCYELTGCIIRISTHTLTWSVTRKLSLIYVGHHISTHTLTWSVTKEFVNRSRPYSISTHTLTWSVT